MELMLDGKAPFVKSTDANGQTQYVQIELHHLSGRETLRSSQYFGSGFADGSLVEIASTVHDKYDSILHIPKNRGESFRVDTLTGGKSEDAKKYDNFRKGYWKHRAEEFLRLYNK